MNKVSHAIVKLRIPIFILALVLVFPAAISYSRTKVNYDMLSYLPQDIDTMKGQNIMVDEFGSGAFSEIIVEGMTDKQVSSLKAKVEKVDHVKTVLWYDSLFGSSIPMNMLPDDIYDKFNNGDATMLFVIYDDTSAADTTTMACREIRALCDVNCFVAGITPVLIDTQKLADQEAPVYVMLAVIFATIILMISMDSFLVPFLFLASIGMAIIYNLGTNFILGSISYVTKALAAVLQLGVTMDYSIFLWHSYEEQLDNGLEREEAMAQAISATFSSVVGSSVTTIAGFIALCIDLIGGNLISRTDQKHLPVLILQRVHEIIRNHRIRNACTFYCINANDVIDAVHALDLIGKFLYILRGSFGVEHEHIRRAHVEVFLLLLVCDDRRQGIRQCAVKVVINLHMIVAVDAGDHEHEEDDEENREAL